MRECMDMIKRTKCLYWIWCPTWGREGTTVDVKSWILLLPFCSSVLEPDFHLEFYIQIKVWNLNFDPWFSITEDLFIFPGSIGTDLSLCEIEGESEIEPFANREISRRLELVLQAHLVHKSFKSSNSINFSTSALFASEKLAQKAQSNTYILRGNALNRQNKGLEFPKKMPEIS